MRTIVSRHSTSEGVVVWSRGPCGHLQMVLIPYGGDTTGLTAKGRTVPCPVCAR